MRSRYLLTFLLLLLPLTLCGWTEGDGKLERIKYNNPGLVTDVGVGLWAEPLPMDFDGDGDNDLVVACAGLPYKGVYLFENVTGKVQFPVFKPAKRLDTAGKNVTVSFVGGKWRVLFRNSGQGGLHHLFARGLDKVHEMLSPGAPSGMAGASGTGASPERTDY